MTGEKGRPALSIRANYLYYPYILVPLEKNKREEDRDEKIIEMGFIVIPTLLFPYICLLRPKYGMRRIQIQHQNLMYCSKFAHFSLLVKSTN